MTALATEGLHTYATSTLLLIGTGVVGLAMRPLFWRLPPFRDVHTLVKDGATEVAMVRFEGRIADFPHQDAHTSRVTFYWAGHTADRMLAATVDDVAEAFILFTLLQVVVVWVVALNKLDLSGAASALVHLPVGEVVLLLIAYYLAYKLGREWREGIASGFRLDAHTPLPKENNSDAAA